MAPYRSEDGSGKALCILGTGQVEVAGGEKLGDGDRGYGKCPVSGCGGKVCGTGGGLYGFEGFGVLVVEVWAVLGGECLAYDGDDVGDLEVRRVLLPCYVGFG